MDTTVRYGVVDRGSYAPKLTVHVPGDFKKVQGCSTYVLTPLPPGVVYDPYTARITDPIYDAQFLGHIELEKPVGWSAQGAYEDEVRRTWWERSSSENLEAAETSARLRTPCHGPACERTAVLFELNAGYDSTNDVQITVPLHVRYHPSRSPIRGPRKRASHTTSQARRLGERFVQALTTTAHEAAHMWEYLVAPHLSRWTERHYQAVTLATEPRVFAACRAAPDASLWTETSEADLLPPEYAHLRSDLASALAPNDRALYTPRARAEADTALETSIPVGDVSLYPAVLLATAVAVLAAMRAVLGSVRRASAY